MVDSKENNNLLKNSSFNALSGGFFFLMNTLVALILNPLMVNYLGSSYFGIWKSLLSFLGFATFADGGTQALKWTIANQESSNDFEKKKREVGSAIQVWLIFLPFLLLLIGLLTYFSPSLINNTKSNDANIIRLVAFLLGVNLIITPLFNVPEAVMIGINRGYFSNIIKSIWLIIGGFIFFCILYFDFGVIGLAYATIIITILRGLNYIIICKKKVPWFGFSRPKRNEIRTFLNFSSWKLVWTIVARFIMSNEIIFLSLFIGASAVSQYVFTSYLSLIGVALAGIISSSITPALGHLFGGGDYKTSQKIINQLRELLFTVAIFIASLQILFNKSFVFIWAGEGFFLGEFRNILISIMMIQLVLIRNEANLIDLSLKIRVKSLYGILSVILTIILISMFYFIHSSIDSILIGILFGRLILLMIYPTLTNRIFNTNKSNFVSLGLIFKGVLLIGLSIFVSFFQFFDTWVSLVIFGILEAFLFGWVLFYFFLGTATRNLLLMKFNELKDRLK